MTTLPRHSWLYLMVCTEHGVVMSPACSLCGVHGPGVLVAIHTPTPDPREPARIMRATFKARAAMAGLAVQAGWCVTSQRFYCPECQERRHRARVSR